MVLEMIPEEPEDEYVDLFNLPEGKEHRPSVQVCAHVQALRGFGLRMMLLLSGDSM